MPLSMYAASYWCARLRQTLMALTRVGSGRLHYGVLAVAGPRHAPLIQQSVRRRDDTDACRSAVLCSQRTMPFCFSRPLRSSCGSTIILLGSTTQVAEEA